jgi:hypothetical protein
MASATAKTSPPKEATPAKNGTPKLSKALKNDPLLSAIGIAKHLWPGTTGDDYIEELRQDGDDSLLALVGSGSETWEGVDAVGYINRMRAGLE